MKDGACFLRLFGTSGDSQSPRAKPPKVDGIKVFPFIQGIPAPEPNGGLKPPPKTAIPPATEATQSMSKESKDCKTNLALIYASMLARLWLAVRAIQSGIEKFAISKSSDEVVNIDGSANEYGLTAAETVKGYDFSFSNLHAVPESMMKQFEGEPLMMGFALKIFDKALGPALIVVGICILLGIAYRTSLFVIGLIYISLTWGLILLGQPGASGVAWLGTHVLVVIAALALAEHNRLAVLKKW